MRWLREWWLNRRAAFELADYTARYTGLPEIVDRKTAARFRASGLTPKQWYMSPQSWNP